uniref:Reverse transcriptase domain-containing protein n=1 Tax=Tanacetum cinerariifolium TaxID=118510 RepID=A0A699HF35_TANCI|nr:reverse transcriptase domain-containing protein [Tanacetum cinerariifolium]
MSTRSSARNLFPPLDNPELTIRRRSRNDPTLLNDFEMATEGNGDPPVPDLRTLEELCQPSLNGRVHGLPGDDANKHLDKFLHVTQSIKVNGFTDDTLRLRPKECYDLIENMTAHHNDWDTSAQRSKSSSSITSSSDMKIVALKAKMAKINKNLMRVLQVNQQVKAVTPNCKTCGGPHSYKDCQAIVGQTQNVYAAGSYQGGTLPSNIVTNLKEDLKGITARSGTAYQGPTIPTTSSSSPQEVERETEPVVAPIIVLVVAPVSASKPNQKPSILTLLNEHCLAVLLKKLLEKLGDLGKFLIPCDFSGMDECLALADLGASINLMPLSVWNKLSLPELTPSLMTLELADQSISRPIGVIEDVFVKVGKLHFAADFVVVDFDADPQVPLILERSFLNTKKALLDVYQGELTLRVGNEAITFNLDQTLRYSANYNDMTANRIDVIDMVCEEYSQKVLGFSDVIASGNPTPYYDPIVFISSATLTPFEDSDFLLEEVDAYLALEDDPTSLEVDHSYFDIEGDILLLEAFLNDDPSLTLPAQGKYLPQVRKKLKIYEAKNDKSSIDEPLEVELKDLPSYLEYAFLEGDDKLPVIIAKDLSVEEKAALTKFGKSHKQAIAWKLFDIKSINLEFCTHKILMEDDFEPTVQHQRRVNLKIHDVIKIEVLKLLNAGLIYPVSNSPWEKSYFMVKEGIVLGHKISKNRIEVDKAKVDVIAKLPHPTTVKGIRSFLGHAGFYRRFIQNFSKIAPPMTHLLEKDTPFFFSKECVKAFQTLKKKLTEAPILIVPDWDLPFELMCDASYFAIEFKFKVIDTKGAENLAADHLSLLENPHQNVLDPKEINETFPLKTLNMVSFRGNSSIPWFDDFANYHAGNFVVKGMSS